MLPNNPMNMPLVRCTSISEMLKVGKKGILRTNETQYASEITNQIDLPYEITG